MIAMTIGTARRNVIELRRYAFDTFFSIAGIYVLFLVIFYGIRSVGGASIRHNGTLPSLVTGFVVFGLVLMSYSSISNWMTQEATLGTLEQLAMSPFGLLSVLCAEYWTNLIYQGVVVTSILLGAEAVTGQWLHLHVLTLAPLLLLLLIQQLGVALALAGLAMIYKRMVALTNLVQFGFVALISAPVTHYPALRFLPVSLANDLIRRATVENTSLLGLPRGWLLLLVGLAFAYFLAGAACFQWADRTARARGVMGTH